MFLIILGSRSRNKSDEDMDAPLFDEDPGAAFVVQDDEELVITSADEGLAEVVIEKDDDELVESDHRPRSLFEDEPAVTVEPEVADEQDEKEDVSAKAEDDDPSKDESSDNEGEASSENIYEFRPPEQEDTEEPEPEEEQQRSAAFAATSRNEETAQEQSRESGAVRYAASSFKPSSISFSDIEEEQPATPNRDEEPPRPYMTWYAREDMERAEERQSEHLNRLEQQISSLRSEQTSRLDLVINALDKKLDRLAQASGASAAKGSNDGAVNDIAQRMASLSGTVETQTQRLRAITQILDDRLGTVSHVYSEVRAVGERLDKLSDNINKLENNIAERASHDVMADVQLSDVVRSSLPPDTYEFKHLLPNNNRADCLVRLPHPPGAIVIDTRFPLDAFNALPTQEAVAKNLPQAKAAEDAFRRAALRHIIDVAERFIIPGETADSALLFLPTEAIYTTLHSRFPDVVRDSFRARVWLVSTGNPDGHAANLARRTARQPAA